MERQNFEHIKTTTQEVQKNKFFDIFQNYLEQASKKWIGKPIEFALELQKRGAQAEDYRLMIPLIKDICLNRIELLQTYQTILRGDSVCRPLRENISKEKIIDYYQKQYEDKQLGGIRNNLLPIDTSKKKLWALNAFMYNLIKVYRIAQNRSQKNLESHDSRTIPIIIYGFRKDYTKEQQENISAFDEYFTGEGDDIGAMFRNVHIFVLPIKKEGEEEILFPFLVPSMSLSFRADPHKFSGREVKQLLNEVYPSPLHEHYVLGTLMDVRAYFHSLLLIHKIFLDIEQVDQQPNLIK